ncbi:hypothetical protein ABG79_01833 [Caloramator mitchellensis]|uniref:Lipoprotein n=1 Tax=Caloramator mitchellensis TaxID=908809 RepID=A0A0R3JS58_CALMK|nr:membrane lipoprotein lipid attachment site-containing protein [Caloramator mitchellensis]KRQ86321.1 hypothetical protein ABG79_01833 [Caloramator mitchellensis]
MKKIFLVLTLAISLLLSACSATDVVGKNSKSSFKKLYEKNVDSIGFVSNKQRFVFSLPSNETFEWGTNFKGNKSDIVFEVDATPFINAGLDTNKLPEYIKYDGKKLIFNFDISENDIKSDQKDGAVTFSSIIDKHRDLIGYHEELQHFGLTLKEGYKVEWAKDVDTNDKDLVLILNPGELKEMGVDVNKVEGWTFTKMKEMDKEVELLLKPFDLK